MSRASTLKVRAEFLKKLRNFLSDRNVLEVDPGALVPYPPNDSNIDCISTDQDGGYLHTSPEYAMKRLLAEGLQDIYFLGHVYRKNELGEKHNPEFTMLEWYRVGISFEEMIQETCEILFLFLGEKPIERLSYHNAFMQYAGVDYDTISLEALQEMTNSKWEKKVCLHYLLSTKIEPFLGKDKITVLSDFPLSEAALACTKIVDGRPVSERFEIYYNGLELCNGYHELNDEKEIRQRFIKQNEERKKEKKEIYPLDEKFLSSLKHLPDCCGVALGFDRALMLHLKAKSIKDVIPFSWTN